MIFLNDDIIIFFYSLQVFHTSSNLIFHLNLKNSKFLLSIPVDFNRIVVWMVRILSQIFSSFNLLFRPLGTFPRASMTIGITITLIFHSFFCPLEFVYFFFHFFCNGKFHLLISSFLLINQQKVWSFFKG